MDILMMEQKKQMEKIYLACVQGIPVDKEGVLEDQIEKVPGSNLSRIVGKKTKNSRKAVLEYKVLKEGKECSLLEIHLKTGRHHQIRCQLSDMGCVIKGDLKYGAPRSNPDGSICLHSRRVTFIHPVRKEEMTIEAPVPPSWKGFGVE